MNLNEYQLEAKRSSKVDMDRDPDNVITFMLLGLGISAESGEVADEIKKFVRDKPGFLDDQWINNITEELGDVLWYLSQIAHFLQVDLEDVAIMNLHKLKAIRREMEE